MKVRKFLAGFLSAAMIFSMMPANVSATDTKTTVDSGNVSLTETHEHDFETNEPVLSEDGTKLIYTCAVEGCEETYEMEYAADTLTVMSEDGTDDEAGAGETEVYVAQIGETKYETLAEAVKEVTNSTETTITLTSNVNEDIVIAENQNIILDLDNHTLTNVSGDTITNNGTLTVQGSGTVKNIVNGKAALVNVGTVYLNNGEFVRNDETGNSYYTVVNQGTMTIDGAKISNDNRLASCVENGWYNDEDVNGIAKLTVVSGEISGGLNALKNDAGGELEVKGGTITNSAQYAIMNWNQAIVTGGTITCTAVYDSSTKIYPAAIYNQIGENEEVSAGKLNISGGVISTTQGSTYALDNRGEAVISGNAALTGGSSAVQSTGNDAVTIILGGTLVGTKYYAVTASFGSKVEINGGSLSGQYYVVRIATGTELVITNGVFQNTAGKATLYVGDGTKADISGGDFSGSTKYAVNNNGGYLTITGGKFESPDSAVYVKDTTSAVTTISGGTFTTGSDKNVVTVGTKGSLSVSGGTFSNDISAYLEDGYTYSDSDKTVSALGVASITSNGETKYYDSLQSAINAAGVDQTVKLVTSTEENITIAASQSITLDLNGKTLTNKEDGDTITVALNGTLTVTGSGTVDNVSHQRAAIVNNGTTTLSGGSYTRSKEASKTTEDANGNSYYNILNHGQMTIGEGVSVISSGAFSSLIDNGYYNYSSSNPRVGYVSGVNQEAPTLTIEGGTFSGGINTIKNDDAATVTINGGTFSNVTQAVVFNCNTAVITGGNFEADGEGVYAVNNQDYNSGVNVVTAEISGGTFNGTVYNSELAELTISDGIFNGTVTSVNSDKISISGGSFASAVPKEYCANGYEPGELDSDTNMYSVQKVKVAQIGETTYEELDNAIDAVQPGETITLLANVTLADDTPAKIMDKGTADSPIILDLNGYTISGSNSKNGTTETTTTPGGILWIYGSYVTLTDNSEGEKGGIINIYEGSSAAYGLVIRSTESNVGGVTISGGVTIDVTGSTSTSARAIHFQNNTNSSGTLTLTIEDAKVIANKGNTVYASAGSGYSCMVTINGGTFNSTGKANNVVNFSGSATTMTINGGTFYNWSNTAWNEVAKGHVICISQSEESEAFTVTVAKEAPDEYVAYVDATDIYRAICLTEGSDLYLIHSVQTPAGRTIHVKKDVAYIFPDGKYYGYDASDDPGNYKLTLDLAEGVILSGEMALYSADVTVTGEGTLASDFSWRPADGYEMTANGETDGLYSCRLKSGAKAVLTKADGTTTLYNTVGGAIVAARQNIDSTVTMLEDYITSGQVMLNLYNRVVANFTLDLNGHTYTYSGVKDAITVDDGAKLIVTDSSENGVGAIVTEGTRGNANSAIATTGTGGTIVIEKGVTVKNLVLLDAPNSKLTVAGTIDTTGFKTYAISGNGSTGKGDTEIVIKDTAVIKSDPDVAAPAIYHPQAGTLTIEGGEISGYGGIQMCSGDLIISGNPTITATGSDDTANKTGDGGIPDGAAISIVNRGYPGGVPTLTITGNPIVTAATDVDAVQAYTWSNNAEGVWSEVGSYINISGGTYSSEVKETYCAEGYTPSSNSGGTYGVIVDSESAVARIGEENNAEYFLTLQDAVSAVQSGGTITLLADIALDARVNISKTVTLNLNGHSITRGDGNNTSYLLGVTSGGELTVIDSVGNGNINSKNFTITDADTDEKTTYAGIGILTNGTVKIQSGTVSGYYGVYVSGVGTDTNAIANITGGTVHGDNTAIVISANRAALGEGETLNTKVTYPAVVNVSGNAKVAGGDYGITLWGKGAELNVSDSAEVSAESFAISGNGTYNSTNNESGTEINITGGTIKSTGDTGTGIYHPQDGTLNVSGGTISGATGIEMRAGELNVSNGTIKGTGNPLESGSNGGGTTTTGAGIAVVEHTTKLGVKVTISGGTVSGYNALYQKDLQSSGNEDVILSVTGGSFTSTDTNEGAAALSTEVTGYVSGGSYSSIVPVAYCANGYVPMTVKNDNGLYTVITGPKMYGATLTLDGTIGVNFYVDMSAVSEADRADYSMHFTVNGNEKPVEFDSNAYRTFNGTKYYRFTCPVAAKQMTDTITATIYNGNTAVSKKYTYSVKQYCDNAILNADDDSLKSLLNAMLNYGGYAQTYFNYNVENLANTDLYTGLEDPVTNVTADMLLEYVMKTSGDCPVERLGATLLLESDTVIRYYIYLNNDKSIEDYAFTLNGETYTPIRNTGSTVATDAAYYIETPGITAQNLDKAYTLTVSDGSNTYSLSYSALTYAYNIMNNQDETATDLLKNTVKALYLYNKAAKEYKNWMND